MTAAATPREYTAELLRRDGVVHAPAGRPFVLAGGQRAKSYVDVRRALLSSPENLDHLAAEVARLVPDSANRVGAVPTGGLLLLTPVLARLATFHRRPRLRGFYVRDTPKAHGTTRRLAGADFEELRSVGDVVLIEDVVSTGKSVVAAVDYLASEAIRVSTVVAVVDRGLGGREALASRGVTLRALVRGHELGLDG